MAPSHNGNKRGEVMTKGVRMALDFEKAACRMSKGNVHMDHHLRVRRNMAKET